MKINVTHSYAADLAAVWAAFTDPAFYEQKFAALGDKNIEVQITATGKTGVDVDVARDVRLDAPRVLRSVLGEWNTLTQSESWRKTGEGYSNELSIRSDLAPMTIDGTMSLTSDGKTTENEIELNIVSKVPLLGRKLEQFAAQSTKDSLDEEYDFVVDFLGRAKPKRKTKKKASKKKR